jgi:UDP-N-acetylglucosamine 2-epimerase (non-hydrolysing)
LKLFSKILKKISVIFGTRPEAIKLSPLILVLRQHPDFEPHVCVTAQHRELLDQVLSVFGVEPDVDLNLMQPNQSLSDLTARAVSSLDRYFINYKPETILVQGDTTTVFAASLVAFYHKIKIGHVEAGLRTWNKYSPFPEEINRVMTTHLADYHFAPTEKARENLLSEGVLEDRVFVTGNTVIDALHIAVEKISENRPNIPGLPKELVDGQAVSPLVLITGHRRETFGPGFESICKAISVLADKFKDTAFVYPVHLNPKVRKPVFHLLNNSDNIYLIEPLSYLPFMALMDRSTLILTDSGGIQEEAPSLGKPVLVMRDVTERPEAIVAGTAKLIGTDTNRIIQEVTTLLTDTMAYADMAHRSNPYGDGKASQRIIKVLIDS